LRKQLACHTHVRHADPALSTSQRTNIYAVQITVGTDIQVLTGRAARRPHTHELLTSRARTGVRERSRQGAGSPEPADALQTQPVCERCRRCLNLAGAEPLIAPQVEAKDRILGGHIGLSTKNNEVSCASCVRCCAEWPGSRAVRAPDTKTVDVQGLQLGVSALYNYGTHTPYAGFILESTSGVSSAAKSNTFSINQTFVLEDLPVETKLDFQGEVKLPGTKFDAVSNTVGLTGPVDIKFHNMICTLTV
jgi:hypothetical protein